MDRPAPSRNNLLILFFFWPFAAFIRAAINFSNKDNVRIIYYFLILYGGTFVIGKGLDAYSYARDLKIAAGLPYTEFWNIIGGIYASETSVDILGPLIIFIVSRVTSAPQILFAVFAAIFGYFYLKAIYLIVDNYYSRVNYNVLTFLIFFLFINAIFNINGFRFNMAVWLYFFGAYKVIINKDYKYFLLSLASALMHFSFISAVIVLLIYMLVGNKDYIYIPLAVISFLIPNLLTPFVDPISSFIGTGINVRMQGYTNQGYITAVSEELSSMKWFMTTKILYYYLIVVLIYSKIKLKEYSGFPVLKNIFSFSILFLSFANFISVVPSGSRFLTVFYLFATLYIIILFFRIGRRSLHWITIIGLFPMIVNTLIALRQGAETINFWLFSIMPLPFLTDPISLSKIFFN